MQFTLIAKDYTDEGATARRAAARDAHLALVEEMKAKGHHLMGAAQLDDNGSMVGSVMVVDFPDADALKAWLAVEPYVTEKVWERIDIAPCQVGPSFTKMFPEGLPS